MSFEIFWLKTWKNLYIKGDYNEEIHILQFNFILLCANKNEIYVIENKELKKFFQKKKKKKGKNENKRDKTSIYPIIFSSFF